MKLSSLRPVIHQWPGHIGRVVQIDLPASYFLKDVGRVRWHTSSVRLNRSSLPMTRTNALSSTGSIRASSRAPASACPRLGDDCAAGVPTTGGLLLALASAAGFGDDGTAGL